MWAPQFWPGKDTPTLPLRFRISEGKKNRPEWERYGMLGLCSDLCDRVPCSLSYHPQCGSVGLPEMSWWFNNLGTLKSLPLSRVASAFLMSLCKTLFIPLVILFGFLTLNPTFRVSFIAFGGIIVDKLSNSKDRSPSLSFAAKISLVPSLPGGNFRCPVRLDSRWHLVNRQFWVLSTSSCISSFYRNHLVIFLSQRGTCGSLKAKWFLQRRCCCV